MDQLCSDTLHYGFLWYSSVWHILWLKRGRGKCAWCTADCLLNLWRVVLWVVGVVGCLLWRNVRCSNRCWIMLPDALLKMNILLPESLFLSAMREFIFPRWFFLWEYFSLHWRFPVRRVVFTIPLLHASVILVRYSYSYLLFSSEKFYWKLHLKMFYFTSWLCAYVDLKKGRWCISLDWLKWS